MNGKEALALGLLVTGVPSVIYGAMRVASDADSKNDFSMIPGDNPLSSLEVGTLIYGTVALLVLRWIVIPSLSKRNKPQK